MKQVILDTNCLLYAIERRVDPFEAVKKLLDEPVEFVLSKGILNELKSMAGKKAKDSLFASAALKLISAKEARIEENEGPVDGWIARFAAKNGDVAVCTYDRQLRKNLKKLSVRVITLRGRR